MSEIIGSSDKDFKAINIKKLQGAITNTLEINFSERKSQESNMS